MRSLLLRVESCSAAGPGCEGSFVNGSSWDGVEWACPTMLGGAASVSDLRLDELRCGAPVQAFSVAPATQTVEAVAAIKALLVEAGRVGAKVVNALLPPVVSTGGGGAFRSYQDQLTAAYQWLHQARLAAESAGVMLALDASANGALLSPVELRELIDQANSWAIGACVDADRIGAMGSVLDWLSVLNRRVCAVRVGCGPGPYESAEAIRREHAALFDRLDGIGFAGCVIVVAPAT
ncbi:MAG: hypothetical protein AABZ12_13310 [Planctomycetota bacterium]